MVFFFQWLLLASFWGLLEISFFADPFGPLWLLRRLKEGKQGAPTQTPQTRSRNADHENDDNEWMMTHKNGTEQTRRPLNPNGKHGAAG